MRDAGVGGNVLSFEPHPSNFKRIRENVALNELRHVVTSYDYGLSQNEDSLDLVMREDFADGSSTGNASVRCNESFDAGFPSVTIQVKALDEVLEELPVRDSIDVIKVDIEGHEEFFLKGARRTVEAMRPIILTEVNPGFLRARGQSADEAILANLPDDYCAWEMAGRGFRRLKSLNALRGLHNVFLIPSERQPHCQKRTKGHRWI